MILFLMLFFDIFFNSKLIQREIIVFGILFICVVTNIYILFLTSSSKIFNKKLKLFIDNI